MLIDHLTGIQERIQTIRENLGVSEAEEAPIVPVTLEREVPGAEFDLPPEEFPPVENTTFQTADGQTIQIIHNPAFDEPAGEISPFAPDNMFGISPDVRTALGGVSGITGAYSASSGYFGGAYSSVDDYTTAQETMNSARELMENARRSALMPATEEGLFPRHIILLGNTILYDAERATLSGPNGTFPVFPSIEYATNPYLRGNLYRALVDIHAPTITESRLPISPTPVETPPAASNIPAEPEEDVVNMIFRPNITTSPWVNFNSLLDGFGNYNAMNPDLIAQRKESHFNVLENLFFKTSSPEKPLITLSNAYNKFAEQGMDFLYVKNTIRIFKRRRLSVSKLVDILKYLELPIEYQLLDDRFIIGKGIIMKVTENNVAKPLLVTTYNETTQEKVIYVSYELREYDAIFNAVFKHYISLHKGTVIFSNTRIYDIFAKLNIPKFRTVIEKKNFLKSRLIASTLNG